ncbi:hypothetical protein [Synechococcus sp. GEYO]|uniref:hypothetical protein n=1 Tax=Synechococcus sp. GEYO TaxID=2575511 RepID=UPI000E0F5561|nr:hypothetical protein [Synechococcus sp. GEYO]
MNRTGGRVWNKTWRILSTLLIALLIPPGMGLWALVYGGFQEGLRAWVWDLSYWLPPWVFPMWATTALYWLVAFLWFGLPWVVIVLLLIKIWRNARWKPRITESKN